MCGIFGHIGNSDSAIICLKGLKFLEYRGYDSAGIAGIEDGALFSFKEKGKIQALEEYLGENLSNSCVTIGHTRWATHGEASQLNAHPHLDDKGSLAIVHNGILENHRSLKEMLLGKGYRFRTDTDSEVISQLIAYFYHGDILKAVHKALSLMVGTWGLAIVHVEHPNMIIAVRKENPIVVAHSPSTSESFVSSDPYAFGRDDLNIFFLKNHEIAIVTRDEITLFDNELKPIVREKDPIKIPKIDISKSGYTHFMLKEIFEQPEALRRTMKGRTSIHGLELSPSLFTDIGRVLILGCGTSWHAGCIAAKQIEAIAHIPARAEIASEFRYSPVHLLKHTLVIALSQSGETLDTIAAVLKAKEQGAKVLALCNVPGSTLVREADETLLLHAGPEISVCSTKAFTSQLCLLTLVATALAPAIVPHVDRILTEIQTIPSLIEQTLLKKDEIAQAAHQFAVHKDFFFLGRQYMYPTSLESALKLKEISYLNANAYPAGELKHGPIALLDSSTAIVGLLGNQGTFEKMLSNLVETKSRGAKILSFASNKSTELEEISDQVIYLPQTCDELAPLPYSVALQLLAYSIALECGAEIDQPRNLAKSVTVE